MSKSVQSPGQVKEKTVPIGSEVTGVETESDNSDNDIKRVSSSREGKPVPITEPTEITAPEILHTQEDVPDYTKENQWSQLFVVFVFFVVCWLLYATLIPLINVWNTSFWLAIPLTIITTLFIILIGAIIWKERRAYKSINRIQETRQQLAEYINEDSIIGVHATLKPVLDSIMLHYPEEYRQFDEARNDRQNVKEYLSLLDNVVLSKLDDDVDKSIKKASFTVAALVAISPHPSLDAVVVMFRANMLLRKIGNIYGLQLTGLSSLHLFKYTIISAITSAAIEEVSTLAMEEIGAGLAGKVASEGIVSATRMHRLGKMAKKMIRPVPL